MKTAAEILRTKQDHAVYTIAPAATVLEAAMLMAERNIGALLVQDGAKIVGIVTERDFARKVLPAQRGARDTPVREVMSAEVMYVRPSHTSEECMALMTDSRLRHLPVMDQGKLIGLVSIGDLVKDIISDQRFTIEQLEQYIRGER